MKPSDPSAIENLVKEEKHDAPQSNNQKINLSTREFPARNVQQSPMYLRDNRLSGLSSSRFVDHANQGALPGVIFIGKHQCTIYKLSRNTFFCWNEPIFFHF